MTDIKLKILKYFPLNRNSLALIYVSTITLLFFIGGLMGVLDYFIVKALLCLAYGALIILAFGYALKNETNKNRLETLVPDDSH